MDAKQALSERIRNRREQLGLNLRAASEAAGTSSNAWRAWESGVSPAATTLPIIARVLDVSLEYLVGAP